jgi:CBS domain-containing protein
VVGVLCAPLFPAAGIDPRIAALVGMAAMFAGASRALLASVVFAFETTWQPFGLLPLLGGCSAAYLISSMLMRHSIMTEKIARRGVHVPEEYSADRLVDLRVGDFATSKVVTMAAEECIADVRERLRSNEDGIRHNGFPVVDAQGSLVGVVTRSDIFRLDCPPSARVREVIRQRPITVHEDASIRHAIDLMVTEDVGRLPVVSRLDTKHLVGIITRSDLLAAYKQRLHDGRRSDRTISLQMDRLWKN